MNQFKRVQVVMLEVHYSKTTKYETEGTIELFSNKLSITGKVKPSQHPFVRGSSKQQHLYIISDDEIKEGDWFIGDNISIKQCTLNNGGNINFKGGWYSGSTNCKKIIATTDTSLYELKIINGGTPFQNLDRFPLPQPSQQFITKYIEEYNKGNVIKDVLVEYEDYNQVQYRINNSNHITDAKANYLSKLKVNPKDNTITIKKLKDSWNREEHRVNIMYCLSLFAAERGLTPTSKEMKIVNEWGDNWCNKNL